MRLAYLDLEYLESLAGELLPQAPSVLAWDIALRFLVDNPADLVVTNKPNPLGIPVAGDNITSLTTYILDAVALTSASKSLPVSWQVYVPDRLLASYKLAWSPAKAGLYGREIGECQRLMAVGLERNKAALMVKKYGGIEDILDHINEVTPKKLWPQIVEALEVESFPIAAAGKVDNWSLITEQEGIMQAILPLARRALEVCHLCRKTGYKCVQTSEDLAELSIAIAEADYIGLDTETSGLDHLSLWPVGVSISTEEAKSWYIPLLHFDYKIAPELLAEFREMLWHHLIECRVPTLMHNAKFDLRVIAKILGISAHLLLELMNLLADTRLMAYCGSLGVVGAGAGTANIGLKSLTFREIGIHMTEISELIGRRNKEQIPFYMVSVMLAYSYAAADADMTRRLYPILRTRLEETASVFLYEELDHKYIAVILEMEDAGVAIDKNVIDELGKQLEPEIEKALEEIRVIAGNPEFNPDSPLQMQELLFTKLKLKRTKRTQSGGYSTDEKSLRSLYGSHPVIRLLIGEDDADGYLGYRGFSKLHSTYVTNLFVHWWDRRLHPEFLLDAVASGRLSSRNPNAQNIPIRSNIGATLRRAFTAGLLNAGLLGEAWIYDPPVLGDYDYSQLELRIMAHLIETVLGCSDDLLVLAFKEGRDPHRETAARMFDCAPEDVTDEQRGRAKTFNFGVGYGLSVMSVAEKFGVSKAEAQRLMDLYFEAMPNVKELMAYYVDLAHEQGFVQTIFYSRRRYLPELRSNSQKMRAEAERQAFNHIIQGTGAEIVKLSQIELLSVIRELGLKTRMILQVHDEVVFEIPESEKEIMENLVTSIAPHVIELAVPLEASLHFGKNWAEVH